MSWRSKSKWMTSSSARAANSAGAGRADPSGARGSGVPGDAAPGGDVPGDVVPRDAGPLGSEPAEPGRADAREVGGRVDRREARAAEDLARPDPGEFAEVELGRLRRAGQVRDDQHRLAPIPPQAREDLLVARAQE